MIFFRNSTKTLNFRQRTVAQITDTKIFSLKTDMYLKVFKIFFLEMFYILKKQSVIKKPVLSK